MFSMGAFTSTKNPKNALKNLYFMGRPGKGGLVNRALYSHTPIKKSSAIKRRTFKLNIIIQRGWIIG